MKRSIAILILVLMTGAGLLTGAVVARSLAGGAGVKMVPVAVAGADAGGSEAASLATGFRSVVKKTLPAVVNISTTKVVKTERQAPVPFFMDPFFRDFFGRGFGWRFDVPREYRERSLGSGVIVSADGYILTNDHVVHGATEIKVSLVDKREFDAKLIGTDPKTDIAVLKIEGENLPQATLGDSSKIALGDVVLAMGNPFGIGQTVTMGIVSATGRGGLDIEDYEDFIQTDAAINPGNSGGPLVNIKGEVIGINTAILSRSGGNVGIGFAVPINMARHVMQQLIEKGRVVRGWLGVYIQPVTSSIAKAMGLEKPQGALVADVDPDSPAGKAGLKTGDVIIGLDGQTIEDSRQLRLRIAEAGPGKEVKLEIVRDGKRMTIPVTLGELPEERAQAGPEGRRGYPLEGVQVDDLTPQVARQLGLPPDTFGVVVTYVEPGSPAAEAGLRRGDVIQEVDRKPVTNVASFERAVREAGRKPVLLLVNRGGRTAFVVVEPE